MPLLKAEEKIRLVSLRRKSSEDDGKKANMFALSEPGGDTNKSQRLSRIQKTKDECFDKPKQHFFHTLFPPLSSIWVIL